MADNSPGTSHRRSFKFVVAPLAILLTASAGTALFWLGEVASSAPDSPTNQSAGLQSRADCPGCCSSSAEVAGDAEAETCSATASQSATSPIETCSSLNSGLPAGMGQAEPGVGTLSDMDDGQTASAHSRTLTR